MKAFARVRALVSSADPLRVDVAVALVFALAMAIEALATDPRGESVPLTIVLGIALVSWLALRRRRPVPAVLGMSAVLLVESAVGNNFLFDAMDTTFAAGILMAYSLGRHADGRWPAAFAVYYLSIIVAIETSYDGIEAFSDLIWIVFLFSLPVLAGRALRSRALLQRELREKAQREDAERIAGAARAIEQERDRIAAELHAVVANGLSAMVVQAEAVPRVLSGGDTERAAGSLAVIEETGRDALSEIRRLLGVLRRDGEGPALAPQPGLARLEALIERQRERGLRVQLREDGERPALPAGVDLTAYRVVEDALEAAEQGGARQAQVLLRHRAGELQVEVRDDRAGGESNRLPGLRERVGLYGGHLSAGREDGRGFRLRARLPLEGRRA